MTECQGCTSCCTSSMHTPGYAIGWLDPSQLHPDDRERLETMPADLFTQLSATFEGITESEALYCGGCMWTTDDGCAHYEWRPQICRDFLPGSVRCSEARERDGMEPVVIPLQVAQGG